MFVVMQRYRVRGQYRDEYIEAMKKVAKAGEDLGCVFFEVYEDDDEKNVFVEMMGFDSWSHYQRLRQIPPTREVEEITKKLEEWIEGGLEAIEVTYLTSVI